MRVSDLNIDRIYANEVTRAADYKMVENHFHYYYELFYVRQGACRFFINNGLYDLKSGDFIIIPPRDVHFNRYTTQCTRINIYFRVSDLVEDGKPFMPNLESRFLRLTIVQIPAPYREQIERLIDNILREDKIDDASTPLMCELLLKQLFLTCDRYCSFHHEDSHQFLGVSDEIVNAAKYIAEHYNQNITLDSIARIANLSPSYLSRKFRQTTGMGIKEYLSYIRLKNASLELLSTQHSITEVAINCGFNDSNYFKDAFKKMYGLSPRAYRNSRTTDYITEQSILNYQNSKPVDKG